MSASDSAKSRMERILRLHEQIDALKLDIRQVYAEEKADGGDKTAMGAAVSYIRKRDKEGSDLADREAMADVYVADYDAPRTHTHAREASYSEAKGREPVQEMHEFDPETGEITNEPEAAAEVAGDYLREPVAAEQGQIIREGDAPRETDRLGGDASCPDAEYSHSQATSSQPADTAGGVNPSSRTSSATHSDDIDLTIPAFLDRRQPKAREWEDA